MDLNSFYKTVADKEYIHWLPDDALSNGVDDILANFPSHFLRLQQFKSLIRNAGPKRVMSMSDRKYKPYGVAFDSDPLDQFFARSLAVHNRSLYDSLKGWTKLPFYGRVLHSLLKFCKVQKTSEEIRLDSRASNCYQAALRDVKELFGSRKFSTLPVKDMMKQVPMTTAAGYPYFKKKCEVRDQCYRTTVSNYVSLVRGKNIEQQPCVLGVRGHLSQLDAIKSRPIWIVSFDNITLENIMFRNVYDFMFSDPAFRDNVLSGSSVIHRLREFLSLPVSMHFVNLDFSAWDTWPCKFLGIDIFNILKEVIEFRPGEERVFNFVRKQFLESSLVLPDGSSLQKSCGTPSGSLLTAMVNSLMNLVVLRFCFRYLDKQYSVFRLTVLGDDAAFYYGSSDYVDLPSEMSALVQRFFGMQLNPSKCLVVDRTQPIEDRKFIGYQFRGSQLYRPSREFFLRALYVENRVPDLKTSFSRVVCYYLLGGCYHDDFTAAVSAYLGHYKHALAQEQNLFVESVFRRGNLRVIKHIFQLPVDELIGEGLSLERFRAPDFFDFAHRFSLSLPAMFGT